MGGPASYQPDGAAEWSVGGNVAPAGTVGCVYGSDAHSSASTEYSSLSRQALFVKT